MANTTIKSIHPFLHAQDIKTSSGCTVKAFSHELGKEGPVLMMVHGYPQSAYIWRHVVPMLKDKISMFIPELPGYGISSMPPKPDKRSVGHILLEALQQTFPNRPVIWCGHDRGARVGHRIIVDNDPKYNILGAILIDIVPTTEQWRAFANPSTSTTYFHWPFLAMPLAPQLIKSMGGATFCRTLLTAAKGGNEEGTKRIQADNSYDVYCAQFEKSETIDGTCAEYASGSTPEVNEQEEDMKMGRKVQVPTMVLYSSAGLGKMHDFETIWQKWVADGVELKCVGFGDGHGHFIPETDPDHTAKCVLEWVDKVSK